MILKSSKQIFISYVYNTQLKDLWREIQRGEIARQSSLSRRSMFSFWRLKIGGGGGNFTEELKHVRNPKFTMKKKKKRLDFSHNENFLRQIELNIYLGIGSSYTSFQRMTTIDSRTFGSW